MTMHLKVSSDPFLVACMADVHRMRSDWTTEYTEVSCPDCLTRQEPEKTLREKLIFPGGEIGSGPSPLLSVDETLGVFREHYDSKREDIQVAIENFMVGPGDTYGLNRRIGSILFGDNP